MGPIAGQSLRQMQGISWISDIHAVAYQMASVQNDEVQRLTGQPNLTAIEQSRRLKLFGRTARARTQMPK